MTPSRPPLQHTPLYEMFEQLDARFIDFAGYAMPVQFPRGLVAEHLHTRSGAGLFDVSHMGQVRIKAAAPGTLALALESLMPMDLVGLAPDHQRYGLLLNEQGGIEDDLMVINRGDHFHLVVNGARKAHDLALIEERVGKLCHVEPMHDWALLALQGPMAASALDWALPGVGKLLFMKGGSFKWQGQQLYVTRSGYTGEDGFEISLPGHLAADFAKTLLGHSAVMPIGLGARNSLRLEAGLCLYGQDITSEITPSQARLDWAVQKVRRKGGEREGAFPGAQIVLAQISGQSRPKTHRCGLIGADNTPVREGTRLLSAQGELVGSITSGLPSPTLRKPIAMGYVLSALAQPGQPLAADVRGRHVPMTVTPMPFVPNRYFRG